MSSHPGYFVEELAKNITHMNKSVYHAADEDHDHDEENDLTIAKVTAILVLGIISFLIGILPAWLSKWCGWNIGSSGGRSLIVSLLLCFGGGVLMFTTFLHLQPENREAFEGIIESGAIPEYLADFKLPDLIFCMGFFFVYLIEEVVHVLLDHKNDHSEEEEVLHRSMSLRKCSQSHQDPPTLIPRATLSSPEIKSQSKQILLESSSNSTVTDGSSPELDYLPKVIPTEHILAFQKPEELTPKFIIPQQHSHIAYEAYDDTKQSFAQSVRAFCTVLALSFHAVFEGLAVGLEGSVNSVWYMAGAIAAHKFVISFCVGIELLTSKTRMMLVVLYIGTFAIVTPIGIGIGIILSHGEQTPGGEVVNSVLQAMAAGTLLYVVFFEVLQRERSNGQSGILQLIAIMAGFGVMFGLGILTKEGHNHSHNHTGIETKIHNMPAYEHHPHHH